MRDISNNLKLYRAEIFKTIDIEQPHFAANAETGLKPLLAGYDIEEVPVSWINRTIDMGSSSFHIAGVAPGYFRALAGMVWNSWRDRKRLIALRADRILPQPAKAKTRPSANERGFVPGLRFQKYPSSSRRRRSRARFFDVRIIAYQNYPRENPSLRRLPIRISSTALRFRRNGRTLPQDGRGGLRIGNRRTQGNRRAAFCDSKTVRENQSGESAGHRLRFGAFPV